MVLRIQQVVSSTVNLPNGTVELPPYTTILSSRSRTHSRPNAKVSDKHVSRSEDARKEIWRTRLMRRARVRSDLTHSGSSPSADRVLITISGIMVTRFAGSVCNFGTRPSPFVVGSIGPESFVRDPFPSRQLDVFVTVEVSTRQRSRSQGCYRLHKRSCARSVRSLASWRWNDEEIAEDALGVSFQESVKLFNAGEYYQCHDVLESLWNDAREPQRSILHGILQCAVGLYHLLHQNHRGAMVQLGEGLTRLRRVGVTSGPLYHFEQETSAVLEFIYNTQLEHAACSDDICITMDGSEQSYRLLGNFGAGQILYKLAEEADGLHIHFVSQRSGSVLEEFAALSPARVKVPVLRAEEADLYTLT